MSLSNDLEETPIEKKNSISSEERSVKTASVFGGDDAVDIDANVQYAGILKKPPFGTKSYGMLTRWTERFCVVKESFLLYYDKSEKKHYESKKMFNIHPKGVIPLANCSIEKWDETGKPGFKITHASFKTYEGKHSTDTLAEEQTSSSQRRVSLANMSFRQKSQTNIRLPVTEQNLSEGNLVMAAKSPDERDNWIKILQECSKITWNNAQLGAAQIKQLEENTNRINKERTEYIEKLRVEAEARKHEAGQKEEYERLSKKLEEEKAAMTKIADQFKEEKEMTAQELLDAMEAMKKLDEERTNLDTASKELEQNLKKAAEEKARQEDELKKQQEEKERLAATSNQLKSHLDTVEEEAKRLAVEKQQTEQQLQENKMKAQIYEEEKKKLLRTATEAQLNLEEIAAKKMATELELDRTAGVLEIETKERKRLEKRLRLAEDSLKRLDHALRDSGLKVSIEIEADVTTLKSFFEDAVAEAEHQANKHLLMEEAVRARKNYEKRAYTKKQNPDFISARKDRPTKQKQTDNRKRYKSEPGFASPTDSPSQTDATFTSSRPPPQYLGLETERRVSSLRSPTPTDIQSRTEQLIENQNMYRILDLEEYLHLIEYDQAKYGEYIVLDYVPEDKTGYTRPRWSKRDAHGNIVRLFAPETEEFLFSLRAKLYGYSRDETEYRKLFSEGRYEDRYLSRVQSHLQDEEEVSSEEEVVVVSPNSIKRGSVVNIAGKYEAKEAEVAALKAPRAPPAKPYKNFTRVKIDDPALYESSLPGFYYFDHPFYYDHPSRSEGHQERLTDEEILRSKVRELREQAMIDNKTPDSNQDNDDVIADHKELRKRRGSVSHLTSSFETAELANKLERQIEERPGSARGYSTRDPIYRYNPRYRYYSEKEWKQRVGIDREPRYQWEVHPEKPIETAEELKKRRGSVTKMANSFDSVAYRNEIERNMESDPRLRRDLVKYEVENGLYDYPLYSTRKNKVKDLSLLYREESELEQRPKETVKNRRGSMNDVKARFECAEGRDSAGSEDDMELLRRQNSSLDEMKLRFEAGKSEGEEEEKVTPDSLDLDEVGEYEISPCNSTLSPVMLEKYRKKKQRSRIRSSPEPRKLSRSKSIDQIANVFEQEEKVDVGETPRDLIRISDEDSDDAVKRRSSISNIALQWEEGMEVGPPPKDPTLVSLYTDSEEFSDSSEAGAERKMRVADRARSYVERRQSEDQEMEEQRKWAPLPTSFPDPVPLYNSSEEEEYRWRMRSHSPTKPSRSENSVSWEEPGEEPGERVASDSSSDLEEVRRRSVSDRALRYIQKREEEEAAIGELERWEPLADPPRRRTSLEEESWTRDTYTDTNLTTEDQGFGSISMERHSSRDQEEGRDESGIAHSSDSANFGDSRDSSSSNSIEHHDT